MTATTKIYEHPKITEYYFVGIGATFYAVKKTPLAINTPNNSNWHNRIEWHGDVTQLNRVRLSAQVYEMLGIPINFE